MAVLRKSAFALSAVALIMGAGSLIAAGALSLLRLRSRAEVEGSR